MARIIVCDRCGKTTAMDRVYVRLRRCKWLQLDLDVLSSTETTKYLCGDCANEFRQWLKPKNR